MEEAVLSMAKLSPIVAGLLIIVWYLAKKVDRNDEKQDLRAELARKECKEREDAMRAEAAGREQHLAERLTAVEDRNNQQLTTILASSIEAQRNSAQASMAFARAFERWTDKAEVASGLHRAVLDASAKPDQNRT